jgi:hypothetical protein
MRLSDLSELSEVVQLTCALDEEAHQVNVERTEDAGFIVTFDIRPERIATVTAAAMAFGSGVEATELDPE